MSDVTDIDSNGDERLRQALRALHRDILPRRDLWPSIAARIATNTPAKTHGRVTRNRFVAWALAASLLLALGMAWQLRPFHTRGARMGSGQEQLIASEARAMTRAYAGALRELAASAPRELDSSTALRQLDRSAEQIRSALARDPDARFLLDRLRHTYSLRLSLTQRAVLG